MKLSRGFIKTAFRVVEKSTGKQFDCFIQDYEYVAGKNAGVHESRYNIGINGWNEWSFLYYLDETTFNEQFEIV